MDDMKYLMTGKCYVSVVHLIAATGKLVQQRMTAWGAVLATLHRIAVWK